jgi:hypothetical protein
MEASSQEVGRGAITAQEVDFQDDCAAQLELKLLLYWYIPNAVNQILT